MEETIFWVAQGVGLVALAFSFLANQSKTRDEILNLQSIGALVYMLHFGLLFAWTGLAVHAIVAVRNWIFTRSDKETWAKHEGWMWFFMALCVVTAFFTWEGYISLLPTFALLLGIFARFKGSAATIRFYSLIGVTLWIPYTVVVDSYSGMLSFIVIGIATVIGMFRHDRRSPHASLV